MYISSLSIAHPRDLARTYNQRGQDDAWETVRNYVRAMEYYDRYPNRTPDEAVAHLEATQDQLDSWWGRSTNPTMPFAAEAVFDAFEREWIGIGPNHPHVEAIATLVSQTIAAGRLSSKYEIEWTVTNDSTEERLFDVTETLGIELEEVDAKDVTCYEPTEPSMVARMLAAYDCPVGPKDHGEIPAWIRTSPPHIHRPFVTHYLDLRANRYEGDKWYRVYCSRPETFREQLTSVIYLATNSRGNTRVRDNRVDVGEKIMRELFLTGPTTESSASDSR
ncbi:hypothetical protein [Halomontanus rarus]|uniref:hypothetical protein n=1 Tax=Halomontanus rarus TaxID=3034020 RepID=UPI0023E76634|nr:hypothetical protein [Halovivax sp. TS33]